jgi:hypothetical protein
LSFQDSLEILYFLWGEVPRFFSWGSYPLSRARKWLETGILQLLAMIGNMYYSNSQSCVRYCFILQGRDNESNKLFKLQNVFWIISGVKNHTSCRQIFHDYVLTVCFAHTWRDMFYLKIKVLRPKTIYP